ncbi:MAG TPA: recombinase family protein, partial [Alphaproteobacteria bacterium]|nr:recombinase family protein [Alphaproteobacteria bacterium]
DLAGRWPALAPAERRAILAGLVARIDLMRETLEIRILPGRLLAVLRDQTDWRERIQPGAANGPTLTITVVARLRRTGRDLRLLIDGASGGPRRKPDHSLCRILAQAYHYNAMVMRSDGRTMAALAAQAGVGGSYFTRILRLSFLAPAVVTAILGDRHPEALTAKRLAKEIRLPIAWDQQRALLANF